MDKLDSTENNKSTGLKVIEGENQKDTPSLTDQVAAILEEQNKQQELKLEKNFNRVNTLNQEIDRAYEMIDGKTGQIQQAFKIKIMDLITSSITERNNLIEDDEFKLYAITQLRKDIKLIETIDELKKLMHKAENWYKVIKTITKGPKAKGYRDGKIDIQQTENPEITRKLTGLKDSLLSKLNSLRQKDIDALIESVGSVSDKKRQGLKQLDELIESAIAQRFLDTEKFPNGNYRIFSTKYTVSKDDQKTTRMKLRNLKETIFTKFKSYKKDQETKSEQ